MKKPIIQIVSSILMCVCLISCQSASDSKKDNKMDSLALSKIFVINNRLFNIPSPFQVARFAKESGIEYNKELLNPVDNLPKYSTIYKQSLNLGVYGTDLGYLNIYEQIPEVALYFSTVKKLSTQLGIASALEEKIIQRIDNNKGNRDSLMFIIAEMFQKSDSYLLESERNDVAVLILAGGWVESMYYLTRSIKSSDKKLASQIGEQKFSLNNLITLLRPYYKQQSEELDLLLGSLIELAVIFDGVDIQYQFEEPNTDVANKLTVINSTSITTVTDWQMKNIITKVNEIRKRIVE